MIVDFVSKYFYYVFLGLILLNCNTEKIQEVSEIKKDLQFFLASIMFFIMYIGALGIKSKNMEQQWLLLPFLIDISLLYVLRSRLFIFKTECQKCGKKLSTQDILYIDSNYCSDCAEKPSEEAVEEASSSDADNTDENKS